MDCRVVTNCFSKNFLALMGQKVLLLLLVVSPALGQRLTTGDPYLSSAIQAGLKKYLDQVLIDTPYTLQVSASRAQDGRNPQGYTLEEWENQFDRQKPLQELARLANQISVTVYLPPGLPQATTAKLQQILRNELRLNPQRGDRIVFDTLEMSFEKPADLQLNEGIRDRDSQIQRLESQIQQLDGQLADARLSAQSVNTELSLARQELEQAYRDLTDKEEELEELQQPVDPETFLEVFWPKEGLTILAIACVSLLALLAIFFAYLSMAKVSKAMTAAGNSISGGLSNISSSMAAEADQNGGGDSVVEEGGSSQSLVEGFSMSAQEAYLRIIELSKELNESYSEHNEAILLQYITRSLSKSVHVPEAVASMEILGKELANTVYKKLSEEQKSIVLAYLQSAFYPRPKHELLVLVGEKMKTMFMAETMLESRKLDNEISKTLVAFETEDLIHIVEHLNDDLLARFFSLFIAR